MVNPAKIIDYIDPSLTNREDWVKVGMALKHEGVSFDIWDSWSSRDKREGEYPGTEKCKKVWDSFNRENGNVVTGATLTEIARQQGNDPYAVSDSFLGWDDFITSDGPNETVSTTSKSITLKIKAQKEPFQILDYLEACFEPDDVINIIPLAFKDDDNRYHPYGLGIYNTVKNYCESLRRNADKSDWFSETFGEYTHDAGLWVRINPVNGEASYKDGNPKKAFKDEDTTSWNNALIECDSMSIDEQIAKIEELQLPYKALVYSGGKSVHAIVRIDARSRNDYEKRVLDLYEYCISHGLPVDEQNKNPSRMSRFPGVQRGDNRQILIKTNLHPQPYDEWKKEALARDEGDKLEIISFDKIAGNLPPLAEELIDGVLRKGHKLLIAGPSKCGKSFALISLAIAIAEGKEWMGYKCHQGKVLYLNFEIGASSFEHRIDDIYRASGFEKKHAENFHLINLRGESEPLDTLAPKLEHRIRNAGYSAIIFDPIYKISTGDENSASDMGKFCNLFDEISKIGECACIYCHHHSKGSQGQKNAIDRSSGSGVFARDPDAILDLTELALTEYNRQELNAQLRESVTDSLLKQTGQWDNLEKTGKDMNDRITKEEYAVKYFETFPDQKELREQYSADLIRADRISQAPAYRLSMKLREFKSPDDVEVLFDYPIHIKDRTGYLKEMSLVGEALSAAQLTECHEAKAKKRADEKREWYDQQIEAGQVVTIKMMEEKFGVVKNTIKNWIKKSGDLDWDRESGSGEIFPKPTKDGQDKNE